MDKLTYEELGEQLDDLFDVYTATDMDWDEYDKEFNTIMDCAGWGFEEYVDKLEEILGGKKFKDGN